ncbi:MAG: ABC transporter permease [Candidatus Bathyarchaeota archaeon]|nr:ABC transporter permease [Candidatus Bathyarchaeota archaeon]
MTTQTATRTRPSWITRFLAIVRYEMLWNIRKKKFMGIVILALALSIISLALPPILSSTTGEAIAANPNYAVTFTTPGIVMFLFALVIAMNSISSEFESGTIVPLLTKPVSRTMVFAGKLFATLLILLVTYAILFTLAGVGAVFVYGPQNNLHLAPLGLLGNVISTFIWVAIILAAGSLSKNTMLSALFALGIFVGLLFAVPIISVFVGPSPALNLVPGGGVEGAFLTNQGAVALTAGTDSIGTNLVNYVLHPSAEVNFTQISIDLTVNDQPIIDQTTAYTQPLASVVANAVGIAFAYIIAFLSIAWLALKQAQILE